VTSQLSNKLDALNLWTFCTVFFTGLHFGSPLVYGCTFLPVLRFAAHRVCPFHCVNAGLSLRFFPAIRTFHVLCLMRLRRHRTHTVAYVYSGSLLRFALRPRTFTPTGLPFGSAHRTIVATVNGSRYLHYYRYTRTYLPTYLRTTAAHTFTHTPLHHLPCHLPPFLFFHTVTLHHAFYHYVLRRLRSCTVLLLNAFAFFYTRYNIPGRYHSTPVYAAGYATGSPALTFHDMLTHLFLLFVTTHTAAYSFVLCSHHVPPALYAIAHRVWTFGTLRIWLLDYHTTHTLVLFYVYPLWVTAAIAVVGYYIHHVPLPHTTVTTDSHTAHDIHTYTARIPFGFFTHCRTPPGSSLVPFTCRFLQFGYLPCRITTTILHTTHSTGITALVPITLLPRFTVCVHAVTRTFFIHCGSRCRRCGSCRWFPFTFAVHALHDTTHVVAYTHTYYCGSTH